MKLDLSRFRGETDHLERHYEPAVFSLTDDDFRLAGPVDLVADVRKDGDRVRLTGRVTARLECTCGRCLDSYPVPVDAAFDLLFLPAAVPATPVDGRAPEEEREVDDEDVGVSFYRDDEIDLGEMMREQFYLALPMKPLCQAACRGLCPVCGINRNREVCSCEATWVDPRLEALRKLRDKE
jgi:uncharacterized protein